jgi:CBS domain-containing protein
MKIQVKDFMSTSVVAAEGKNKIGEIRAIMQNEKIHALPIVYNTDGNVIVQGIITSTDLCCQMDNNKSLEEAISLSKVHVVATNASAKSAAEMMLKHHVHHLVVMENGKIVGMISSLDFVKLVAANAIDWRAE